MTKNEMEILADMLDYATKNHDGWVKQNREDKKTGEKWDEVTHYNAGMADGAVHYLRNALFKLNVLDEIEEILSNRHWEAWQESQTA